MRRSEGKCKSHAPRFLIAQAAHCVRRLKRSKIRVILGDHDQFVTTETEAIQRAVSAIIRHRNFDQNTYNHDIALLRLRKPVTFTKGIQPICLPKESIDPSGKQGTVVGWGRTSEGGSLPGILQHVTVPVLTLDQCRGMKYRASRITPNMVRKPATQRAITTRNRIHCLSALRWRNQKQD
jgi:secreted trypsin-like serine protease